MTLRDSIELHKREGTSERCAVCHDAGDLIPCDSCRALFHADCLTELGGCSTLGCQERARVTIHAAPVELEERPSWIWAIVSSWLLAMALLGVLEGIGQVFREKRYPEVIPTCREVAFVIQVFVLPLVLASAWGRPWRSLARLLIFQLVAVPGILAALHRLEGLRDLIFIPIFVSVFVFEPAVAALVASASGSSRRGSLKP